MTQGGLRKRPVQERSKATIQTILDTASRLLVDVGYEAVTASPTLILNESGISRGSFYSFFETPEKVLEELAFQCMKESAATLTDDLRPGAHAHWHDVVDVLLHSYVDSYDRPLVRELWVGQNLTPPARAADREWMQGVAAMILAALKAFDPLFARLTVRQCLIVVEILERLFQYAYTDEPLGDPALVHETRIVLVQYLSSYAGSEATGLPVRGARRTM